MTRISSQRGLNAMLDQIGQQNAVTRSEASHFAGASNNGNGQSGFDLQLSQLAPDANEKSIGDSSNPAASSAAAGHASPQQSSLADPFSALFEALSAGQMKAGIVTPNAFAANTAIASPLTSSLADIAAGTLALTGAAGSVLANASGSSGNNVLLSAQSKLLSQTSQLSSTAQAPSLDTALAALPKSALHTAGKANLSSSSGDPVKSSAPVNSKRPAPSSGDSNSPLSGDLAASALTAAIMLAASPPPRNTVTPQNTAPTQASRKDAAVSAGSLNAQASASMAGSIDSQSQSAYSLSEQGVFNPFGDLSQSDGMDQQSIKMNVSSIDAQTHFAPVQQLSPTQQIAGFVATAAGTIASSGSSGGEVAASTSAAGGSPLGLTATPTSKSPVKTLTLALEPDALGTVTIKMRLVDSGLDLQVEAEKSSTTGLIEKDKESLSAKLQSLGYSIDSLVVKTAASLDSRLDLTNGEAAGGQGQQASSDTSASGSSQNGGRNTHDQSPTQSKGQSGSGADQDTGGNSSPASNRGHGVYL